MSRQSIRQGTRYRAKLALGFLEQFASNEMIASHFASIGFAEVTVIGEGANRVVEALWPLPDTEGEVPAQVVKFEEIGP